MERDHSYNVSSLFIYNDEIRSDTFFKQVIKIERFAIKNVVQERNLPNKNQLGIQLTGSSGVLLEDKINNTNIQFYNIKYNDGKRRGVFHLNLLNISDKDDADKKLTSFNEAVHCFEYPNLFAYEVSLSFQESGIKYRKLDSNLKFDNLNSSQEKAIKIISNYKEDQDLREQFISEISMEMLPDNPNKSIVTAMVRKEVFQENLFSSILGDVFKVINEVS
jgi:hypothetical protein